MIKNYNDHSANERTFLAWVRTAMAVVGFGLAAGRLDGHHGSGETEIGLLLAGALVIILAYVRSRRLSKRIDSGEVELDDPPYADIMLMSMIGALFLLMGMFALNVG